jgi:RecB family exonuclease
MARYLFGFNLDGSPPPADFCRLDTAVVGADAFLSALEASLGLPPLEMGNLERALAYRNALAAHTDADAFFAGSFEVDPLATARLLLGWRDELVEAGWNPQAEANTAAPPRLQVLTALESAFAQNGAAQCCAAGRIDAILAELELGSSAAVDELTVLDPPESLPSRWRTLLDRLGATYDDRLPGKAIAQGQLAAMQGSLAGNRSTGHDATPDASVRIITASTAEAAADALAAQLAELGTQHAALIADATERDRINPHLHALDLPQLPAKRDAAHAILQLAPLLLRCRWAPLDPQAWIEFLLHPIGPIPRQLRHALAKKIDRKPGRGPHWEEALADCLKPKGDDQAAAQKLQAAFDQWIAAPLIDTDAMDGETLSAALAPLSKWALGVAAAKEKSDEQDASAWQKGASALSGLGKVLGAEGTLNRTEAERFLAEWLDSALPSSRAPGELGSVPALSSPAQLLDQREHVIWWRPRPTTIHRAPWTCEEKNWLQSQGAQLLDETARVLATERVAHRAALLATKSLTIYHVTREAGGSAEQPSFITRLIAECGKDIVIPAAELTRTQTIDARPLPAKRRWWQLDTPGLLPTRPAESFTSAEAVIYSPYRWVLERQANLWPGKQSSLRVRDHIMRQGSALHAIAEVLFAPDRPVDWHTIDRPSLDAWLEASLPGILAAESAHYLVPGQEAARARLLHTAKGSFWSLVELLRESKITEIELEKWIEAVPFVGGTLHGRIDVIARRADGQTAVIDLKLGGKGKRYEELTNNRHLQLAIYGQLLRHSEKLEAATAFFILANGGTPLTRNGEFFGPSHAVRLKDEAVTSDWQDAWSDFESVWQWRRQQLDDGKIEVTVGGTTADELPPLEHWQAPEGADRYSPFSALTGWDTNA